MLFITVGGGITLSQSPDGIDETDHGGGGGTEQGGGGGIDEFRNGGGGGGGGRFGEFWSDGSPPK